MKSRTDNLSCVAAEVTRWRQASPPPHVVGYGGWFTPHASRITSLAFSLIEIMVVVALLSIIVIGLMAMFGQTQRAFTQSRTQVDVLESGRAHTEMMGREISQVTPAYSDAVNFYAEMPVPPYQPLEQPLPGGTIIGGKPLARTNVIEEIFFLTRENQDWIGIGYRVDTPANGIGTLYRTNLTARVGFQDPAQLFAIFKRSVTTNMSRIMDGVVHLKVRAYTTNGNWITPFSTDVPNWIKANVQVSSAVRDEIGLYAFTNSAVPATVEIEMGILEDRPLARLRALPDANARAEYLKNQVGRTHLFSQRIPIRNVDPGAYQ